MPSLVRRSFAEALGTFVVVFIGAGSVAAKFYPDASYGVLGIAVAHGLALAVMITATMTISGGYLNPAVTIGLLVARRMSIGTAAAFIVAQLAGAVLAAACLKVVYIPSVLRASVLGTPSLAASVTLGQGMFLEAILTFFLVSAVFGTCLNPAAPKVGGFGVGLVLVCDILVGGPLTGAAVNPARAFGPALVSGNWVAHVVYWVGPIVGGIAAALVWEFGLLRKGAA
jgi:aquaporin Z